MHLSYDLCVTKAIFAMYCLINLNLLRREGIRTLGSITTTHAFKRAD